MRITIGKALAATLLVLCVGLQLLEATGRWDRTIQDSGDEAVIVTVVLCIGAALAVASAVRARIAATAARVSRVLIIRAAAPSWTPPSRRSACASAPLSLRI